MKQNRTDETKPKRTDGTKKKRTDEYVPDYDYLFSVIETHAYAGKIGCSYTPRLTTETGLKWMKKYV